MHDYRWGFFAIVCQVLGGLEASARAGALLSLDFNRAPYAPPDRGGRWWDLFFDLSEWVPAGGPKGQPLHQIVIEDRYDLEVFASLGRVLPLSHGRQQLSRLALKHEILLAADVFAQASFPPDGIIGVHYRGTDKMAREQPRIPYDFISDYVKRRFGGGRHLFIATDEAAFLEHMRCVFPNHTVATDCPRSRNGEPLHLGARGASRVAVGREALIDSILLSKCSLLLRTESYLSRVSQYFSPDMPCINLTTLFRNRIRT